MAARAYQIWHGDYPVIASRKNRDQKMLISDYISVYYDSMITKVWYFRYRRREESVAGRPAAIC